MANNNWREKEIRDNLIKALKNNVELVVLDVETTGFDKINDRIIHFSGRKFKLENNKLIFKEIMNEYICPAILVPTKIEKLTGITNKYLEDKPKENEVFEKIHNFLGASPNICAHYSTFDIDFLKALYQRYNKTLNVNLELDTCVLAKEVISKYKVANYKLATIANYYGLDKDISFHNAEDDVKVTSQILQIIITEFVEKYKDKPVEQTKNAIKKDAIVISKPSYWNAYDRFSRIYVNTNMGTVYYDVLTRKWCEKDDGAMDKINMEKLISDVFEMVGANNENEFAKYRG